MSEIITPEELERMKESNVEWQLSVKKYKRLALKVDPNKRRKLMRLIGSFEEKNARMSLLILQLEVGLKREKRMELEMANKGTKNV